jgi:hypothetical protein
MEGAQPPSLLKFHSKCLRSLSVAVKVQISRERKMEAKESTDGGNTWEVSKNDCVQVQPCRQAKSCGSRVGEILLGRSSGSMCCGAREIFAKAF